MVRCGFYICKNRSTEIIFYLKFITSVSGLIYRNLHSRRRGKFISKALNIKRQLKKIRKRLILSIFTSSQKTYFAWWLFLQPKLMLNKENFVYFRLYLKFLYLNRWKLSKTQNLKHYHNFRNRYKRKIIEQRHRLQ